MISLKTDKDETIFCDLRLPAFGELNGRQVRVYLYALHGEVNYEGSSRLILENVDAVVFLADAQRERQEANEWWAGELKKHLAEHQRDISSVPLVVCVTKSSFENADPAQHVIDKLGLPTSPSFVIDPTTGQGVSAGLSAIVDELKRGVARGAVTEWQQTEEEKKRGNEFLARSRLVGHYCSFLGDDIEEYVPVAVPEDRPGFIVVEHRPTTSRPYFTYATAGLSLWEQIPGGPQPRLEFMAYSQTENQRVADVLIALAKEIHSLGEEDVPFKIHDTVNLEGCGLLHETFVLVPPSESNDLLQFPDLHKRMKDVRFTHAITGNLEDSVDVTFVHVLPVTGDELKYAEESGTPALLEKMNLEKRGKTYGWGPSPRDSR